MEILKPLNLPPFEAKIKEGKGNKLSIFDPLRNKYVALTPEEWVRQHFIHFLIEHKGYPQAHHKALPDPPIFFSPIVLTCICTHRISRRTSRIHK